MDKFRINSHKMNYHLDRVNRWSKGENVYPIYMEISPSNACNHRCTFCAFEYREYKWRFLETKRLKEILSEMGQLGVKSVMYAGEGEPFLHKDMPEIINHTKESGIDVAVATNGALFTPEVIDRCLGSFSWARISIGGGTRETHNKIHQCPEGDFDKILDHMAYAVKVRNKNKYPCALGFQFLLLPENKDEVFSFAHRAKEIGVDYLIVKPFIRHLMSAHEIDKSFRYSDMLSKMEALEKMSDDKFNIIFRINVMRKVESPERNYKRCLGLPFFTEIAANGGVYTCGPHLGDDKFCYGNIYENSFKEIWEGEKRKEVLKMIEGMDVEKCMKSCRIDEVNKYLWDLKNPPPHMNFI